MLVLKSPTELRLVGYTRPQVESRLAYTDESVNWVLKKFKAGRKWFVAKNGQPAFDLRVAELEAQRKCSLLFEDEKGLWTYSGLASKLAAEFGDEIRNEIKYPEFKTIPWAKVPEFPNRYYQTEAVEKIVAAKHAAIEHGTGLGKTTVVRNLLKEFGLQAVVMCPSKNIAGQMYDELIEHFGKAKVGFYGDGKKEIKKLFTVGIAASLTRVQKGTDAWKHLSAAKVFIVDESHMVAADTLAKVALDLLACAQLRVFVSGTQVRGDGRDLLLEAITGPMVHTMTVQEGVDQDFLAKPLFRMCWMDSNIRDRDGNLFSTADANDLTRAHVYYNPELNAKAAEIANKAVAVMGRPTVILIDELEQLSYLLPHLRYETKFAHGGVTKENKDKIPVEFHESDPTKLVEAFNRGEFPILVGTSCISTGTNIKPVRMIVDLRQGKSETGVSQGVGRGTRLVPGKVDCIYVDFGIKNVDLLKRHALARKEIYASIYPSYSEVTL